MQCNLYYRGIQDMAKKWSHKGGRWSHKGGGLIREGGGLIREVVS